MQPLQNEKPANVPGRPISPLPAAPQISTPFASAGPVVGLEAHFFPSGPLSGQRTTGVPQPTGPIISPGPLAGAETSGPRTAPPIRFPSPSSLPHLSYPTQGGSAHQLSSTPQFPPNAQPASVLVRSPLTGPWVLPQAGPAHPQAQSSSVPMGSLPQSVNSVPPRANMPPPFAESTSSAPGSTPLQPAQGYQNVLPSGNMPPIGRQFPASKPTSQPPLHAFPVTGPPPTYFPPVHGAQGGFVPPPPPTGAPMGLNSREHMQHPSAGPPLGGTFRGLVEDFQSLSVGSAPGSLDPGVDPKLLPRPLEDDGEPTSVPQMYPLNCHPRFLRLTTHAIPSSQSLLARWHLPLGAVVHPLAEVPDGEEVPVVNFGTAGVIRCRRCRTYVNPYVTFTEAGRKWRCNVCSLLNDVPGEYFCSLDASGRRCDADQRPELCSGSVEFVAPTEYMVRPPMPPLYFFLIDVSASAVRCGLLEIVAKTIKSCLDELSDFPRTQIGFLTFDSSLHFYSLKSSLTQPQMMVVSDLDDIFLPLPDDLLVNLSDSRDVVDAFLDSLPTMFHNNVIVESAFGPALKAAFLVMRQIGGKLLVFQTSLPSIGIGRLRLRGDDLKIYGTDKEHTLRVPEDPFYKQMAADFTQNQIAVDIYAFGDKYSDIASLGSLAKYTGGQVYHYPSFQASVHRDKLSYDLVRDLSRETAWEAVMRIRCGKGVRFTTYHGHFMLRSTDLMGLPAVDCDKAFAMQFSLEDTLLTTQTVYFQVALLYTSSSGERRIRVHNAAAPVVTDLGEMYHQADTGAIISLLSRLAIENTLSNKLEAACQSLQLRLVKSLREYRNLYVVQHRLGGRLIFPESLKFLPLYVLSLCKSMALRGGYADASLDERSASGYGVMISPVSRTLRLLYPSFMRIDESPLKDPDSAKLPKQLALSAQNLDPIGLYVCNNGINVVIWLGRMLPSDVVTSILGTGLSNFPDLSQVAIHEHDNEVSRNLMRILRKLREEDRSCYQLCHIVRQGEQPRESSLLLSNFIEDQISGSSNYVDWMLQIYRQSQQGS